MVPPCCESIWEDIPGYVWFSSSFFLLSADHYLLSHGTVIVQLPSWIFCVYFTLAQILLYRQTYVCLCVYIYMYIVYAWIQWIFKLRWVYWWSCCRWTLLLLMLDIWFTALYFLFLYCMYEYGYSLYFIWSVSCVHLVKSACLVNQLVRIWPLFG